SEKAKELLVPMSRQAFMNDLAAGDVESGEKRGGSMPLVVVCHRTSAALLQRKTRLGTVQGLDLALLVEGEHDRPLGGCNVQPDDIPELRDEARVFGELERLLQVRLEAVRPPNP